MKEIDIMLERWIPVNTIIREEFRNVIIKAMNEHSDNMLKLYTKALDVKIKEQMQSQIVTTENDRAYSNDDENNITCCGDEITGLVKDIGLCPTCLEHI